MNGTLRPGWRRIAIGDVAQVVTGATPPTKTSSFFDGPFPFVTPGDLGDGTRVRQAERSLSASGANRVRLLDPGAVLVTCIGALIGKVGIAEVPLATNQQINAVVPDPEVVSGEFIAQAMIHARPRLERLAGRQAVPIVNKSTLEGFQLDLPPRHEQDRIVEIVQMWDRGIEVGTALISARRRALEVARGRLVERAEGDAAELAAFAVNTNRLVPVQDVARRSFPCIDLEHMEEATGRILGQADTSQLRGTRRAFEAGNVLYGRLRPYLRKFAQAQAPGVCSTEVWVLSANLRMCAPGYLYQIVQTDRFNAEANKSSGSRMPRADWDTLSRVEFSLPPIERQQRIVALLAAEAETLDLLTRVVGHLCHQRTVLMGRLLSGALNVYPANTATRETATRETAEPAHA